VRSKILCPRDARRPPSDENQTVLDSFSGRDRELAVVGGLTLIAVIEASRFQTYAGALPRSTAIVLSLLALVPLVIARKWPSFAAAGAMLLTVTILRTENPPLTVASFCIALFLLVQLVIRRGLVFAAPLLLPFFVVAVVRIHGPHNALGSTAPLLFSLAALAVGESLRRRGQAVAALDETQEAMTESTRARTVMEERARIARELHDIVAHHLSVIAVESEAARLTSPELPPDAGDHLESIAATAREALTETRRLLGVLREDARDEPDRAPQPGLAQLDDLIDKAETTGSHIRFIREGKVARLPLSTDLAAYRIVQEALTNARRHAPGADVEVELAYRGDALHLRVRDHGRGTVDDERVEGHGLMGMRERAALAGGTFSAGPADGGGFEVKVMLPSTETTQ
jgi:signal transduction histidine kinase